MSNTYKCKIRINKHLTVKLKIFAAFYFCFCFTVWELILGPHVWQVKCCTLARSFIKMAYQLKLSTVTRTLTAYSRLNYFLKG